MVDISRVIGATGKIFQKRKNMHRRPTVTDSIYYPSNKLKGVKFKVDWNLLTKEKSSKEKLVSSGQGEV